MSEYTAFLLHKMLVVTVNCLMLGALFLAMYRASLTPDEFNITFFKTLLTLLLPTLVLGFAGKYLLRRCHRPA